MQDDQVRVATEARFIRKKQEEGGYDEQDQNQEREFKEDFEKALKTHGKKQAIKDVEKQIEYFGYKIEPFNMREEEQMGQIDEDGFFVFNNRKRLRDAWMDSLNENEGQQAIDTLRKRIKQEQREKNVYQAEKKEDQESEQQNGSEHEADQQEQQEKIIEQQNKFEPKEIKMLLAELLPFNSNANQYMKKLKKQKNTELYDRILLLCNEYIAIAGEHDILTLKKEDLEQQEEQAEEKPIQNWDKEQSQQMVKDKINKTEQKQQNDQDDIF